MIELNKIYCEDCMITMQRMEDNSVDLIITSPPYNKHGGVVVWVVGDATIHETQKLFLDKETRDCIVNALKERIETLKKEIKGIC